MFSTGAIVPPFGTQTPNPVFGNSTQLGSTAFSNQPSFGNNLFGGSQLPNSTFNTVGNQQLPFGTSTNSSTAFNTGQTSTFLSAGHSSSVFSASNTISQPNASTPAFGNTTSSSSGFGQSSINPGFENTSIKPAFGLSIVSNPVFGGSPNLPSNTSITSITDVNSASKMSPFGGSSSTSTSGFGFPATYSTPVFSNTGTTNIPAFGRLESMSNSAFSNTKSESTLIPSFGSPATSTSLPSFHNSGADQASAFGSTMSSSESFGNSASKSETGNLFGKADESSSMFVNKANAAASGSGSNSSLFSGLSSTPGGTSLFSNTTPTTSSSVFGGKVEKSSKPSIFGGVSSASNPFSTIAPSGEKEQKKLVVFSNTTSVDQSGSYETSAGLVDNSKLRSSSVSGTGSFTMTRQPKPSSPVKKETSGLFGKSSADIKPLFGKLFSDNSSNQSQKVSVNVSSLFGKKQLMDSTGDKENSDRDGANPVKTVDTMQSADDLKKMVDIRSPKPKKPTTGLFGKVDTTREKRRISTVLKDVDVSNKVAIIVQGLQAHQNKKSFLEDHFGKFGKVTRIFPNLNKRMATIHFSTHEAADRAKMFGSDNMSNVSIFWSRYNKKPSKSENSRSLFNKEDINEELEGMLGAGYIDAEATVISRPALPSSDTAGKRSPMFDSFRAGISRTGCFSKAVDTVQLADDIKKIEDIRSPNPKKPTTGLFGKVDTTHEKSRVSTVLRDVDVSNNVAIVIHGLQARLNKKSFLEDHFGKFGKVTKILPNLNKRMATIHFSTHEAADRAKMFGSDIPNVSIFWSRHNKKPPKSENSRSLFNKEDINEELEGMLGVGNVGLKNVVALTSSEKCALLENRDKLIRQGMKKELDLSKAKATVGTCPDMCPEKERYLREEQRRLHIFEIIPGSESSGQNVKVDHALAVKEYSRSSADQEEPLPHELRPPHVLSMTMDYMNSNIMDYGCDSNWSDWYDFLWNRTRGIRKDITQQHLCDLTVVDVVEKCGRFHIFCAERLCELGMMSFDAKINNENLTKCLQTLKELYHDLETKQNIHCPNEAEFRAYTVLMNLNEGDTLREVQILRDEIRESPTIQFSLRAYEALNSNNYIRFFKLVDKASFLNACIMHRYFNQVREKAIDTMLRAYKKPLQFPVEDIKRMLAFENNDHLEEFCVHHGLSMDDNLVNNTRTSYYSSETSLTLRRSSSIENKLITSVGEAVNGGPFPKRKVHEPSSSFDQNGRFLADVNLTQVAIREHDPQESEHVEEISSVVLSSGDAAQEEISPVPHSVSNKLLQLYSNESMKEVARELFLDVIGELCTEMSSGIVGIYEAVQATSEGVIADVIESMTRDVSTECNNEIMVEQERKLQMQREELIRQQQLRQEERLKQELLRKEKEERENRERMNRIELLSCELCEEITNSIISEEILKLGDSENRLLRCADDINSDIFVDVIDSICHEIAQQQYYLSSRQDEIKKIGQQVQLMKVYQYFKHWQTLNLKRSRTKRLLHEFPAAPSMKTNEHQLEDFFPNYHRDAIKNRAFRIDDYSSLSIDVPENIEKSHQIWSMKQQLQCFISKLKYEMSWQPLDLPRIVGPLLQEKRYMNNKKIHFSDEPLFWKLVVLWTGESQDEDILYNWCRVRLGGTKTPQKQSQVETLTHIVPSVKAGRSGQICLSVRLLCGIIEDVDDAVSECLSGADGVLLILGNSQNNKVNEVLSSVSSLLPELIDIPVALLINSNTSQELLKSVRDELEYGISRDVPTYSIANFNELAASEKLCECLHWLVHHSPEAPVLEILSIQDYVDDCLVKFFFTPLYQNLELRKKQGLLHQPPNLIVNLYQCALEHIAETASDADLEALSWPAAEFSNKHGLPSYSWNSIDQLEIIKNTILTLSLPEFEHTDVSTEEWNDAVNDVWKYVTSITYRDPDADATILYSRLSCLLRKVEAEFEDVCYLSERQDLCSPCYVNIPWTEVIVACVEHQVRNFEWNNPSADKEDEELVAVFKEDALNKYQLPNSWLQTLQNKALQAETSVNSTFVRAAKRKHDEILQTTIEHENAQSNLTVNWISSQLNLTPSDPLEAKVNESILELRESLHHEKKEMETYEKYLEETIREGDLQLELSSMNRFAFSKLGKQDVSGNWTLIDNSCTLSSHSVSPASYKSSLATLSSPVQSTKRSHLCNTADDADDLYCKDSSISDKVEQLISDIKNERKSDVMFEMKLQAAVLKGDILNKTDPFDADLTRSLLM